MIQQLLASVAVIQPPTPCEMGPQYSVHVNPRRWCEAGREFVAVFQSHFVHLPKRDSWLLVSTAPTPPISIDAWGFDRCWLLVNPDPKHFYALPPSKEGIVRQYNGRLVLRWTPPDTMRGATLYSQMIWADPQANDAGYLFGPMLQITVR